MARREADQELVKAMREAEEQVTRAKQEAEQELNRARQDIQAQLARAQQELRHLSASVTPYHQIIPYPDATFCYSVGNLRVMN